MATDDGQYTRDELVDLLQQLAEDLGRAPTVDDLRAATEYPSVRQVRAVFETWNAAKQAAGLETFRKEGRGEPYSDAELLDRLRQLARDTDGLVTMQDVSDSELCPSAVTYQRRFGSWNEAKQAAGLDTIEADTTPVQYTDEELCELLRTLAAEVDGPVTIRAVDEADDYPDHTTFERRFGSWNQAKQAAGLDTLDKGAGPRSATYSDDELIELLRERDEAVDGTLTKEAMNHAEDYPSASTYARRFGSWTKAKEAAGLLT